VKNAIQPVSKAFSQIFIAKFSPEGDLLYSTYFGGSANDGATAIASDPAGNVYVTGILQSQDFPVANAFQSKNGGGVDAFVLKLDASGTSSMRRTWGEVQRFRDGHRGRCRRQCVCHRAHRIARFPVTPEAFQTQPGGYISGRSFGEAYVTKLDPAGNLVYSSFLGGSGDETGGELRLTVPGRRTWPEKRHRWISRPPGMRCRPRRKERSWGELQQFGRVSGEVRRRWLQSGLFHLCERPLDGQRASHCDRFQRQRLHFGTDDLWPAADRERPSVLSGGDVHLVSTDGGKTFLPQRSGLAAVRVNTILFDPNVPSRVYAGTLEGVFRSIDGGSTWTPTGLDKWIEQIVADPARPGRLYAGTNSDGGLYRSTDGGDTWTNLKGPGSSNGAIYRAMAVDPSGSGVIYAVAGYDGTGAGFDQPLYRITEDGAQWTLLGHGLPTTPLSVAVGADSTLFVGTVSFSWVNWLFGNLTHYPGTVYEGSPMPG